MCGSDLWTISERLLPHSCRPSSKDCRYPYLRSPGMAPLRPLPRRKGESMRTDGHGVSGNVALRLVAVAVLGVLYTIIRLGGVHAGASTSGVYCHGQKATIVGT